MIDEQEIKDMLRRIELQGSAAEENITTKPIIGGNLNHILNLGSGMPRIHNTIVNKFKLILQMPLILRALSPFEIRCCLCRSVISYPCWYYSIKYAVNHFHYFVCFDSQSSLKPSCRCYRRI